MVPAFGVFIEVDDVNAAEPVEGVVVRRQNRERLLVAVRFLQQGASLLLEDFQVEAI